MHGLNFPEILLQTGIVARTGELRQIVEIPNDLRPRNGWLTPDMTNEEGRDGDAS